MIGVLTALTLALPQVVVALPTAPGGAQAATSTAGLQSGATEAYRELQRLSCARQRPGSEVPWASVESLLELLLVDPSGASSGGQPDAQGWARLLGDLAIGATAVQRLDLVRACDGLLSAELSAAQRRLLLGAQVALLEPLVAQATTEGRETPLSRRAVELYESVALAVTDAATGEVPQFMRRSRLRLARLRVGAAMPRFVARDTAGNELRSAQLEGEVLVLRFWDPSSPASLVAHRADSGLVRDFWDAPFDLLGVTRSEDREAYLRLIESARFGGVQLFDGPISSALADALDEGSWSGFGAFGGTSDPGPKQRLLNRWGSPPPGSLFVVDARGRIRGRDLPPGETQTLVRTLIAEERTRQRELILEGTRTR